MEKLSMLAIADRLKLAVLRGVDPELLWTYFANHDGTFSIAQIVVDHDDDDGFTEGDVIAEINDDCEEHVYRVVDLHNEAILESGRVPKSPVETDESVTVYAEEWRLMCRIAETSSDYVKAKDWTEFREACGGMVCLRQKHEQAVRDFESWAADGEG